MTTNCDNYLERNNLESKRRYVDEDVREDLYEKVTFKQTI